MQLARSRPHLREPWAVLIAPVLLACAPSGGTESTGSSSTTMSESVTSGTGTTQAGSTGLETSSETEPDATTDINTGTDSDSDAETDSDSDSETGEMCTGVLCDSTLTLTFAHSLPLAEGPHRFTIVTPTHEILCSVGTTSEGVKPCFGFMFSDMSWDTEFVTLVLTRPFFDTDINPDATPFESVMLTVERDQEELFAAEVPVEGGDPIQPDPCGAVCWEAQGSVTVE